MIARISVSACALAQTLGSTDSAAVDAIKFAVGTGRLGLVRRSGASAAGRAVHASVWSVAVLTRAVSSGTDYFAAVDAINSPSALVFSFIVDAVHVCAVSQ